LNFFFSGAIAAALVAGFAVGLHWGVRGVAAGFVVATALTSPIGMLIVARVTRVPAGALARSIGPVLMASACMSAAMIALRTAWPFGGLSALLIVPPLGALVFLGFLLWRRHDVVADLRLLVQSLRAGPAVD
jgi:hypothetical protein